MIDVPPRFRKNGAVLLLAFVSATFCSTQLHACMDPVDQKYIFLDRIPNRLPPGLIALKVRTAPGASFARAVDVKVIAPQRFSTIGYDLRLAFPTDSSCSRWGVTDRPAYVVGFFTRAVPARISWSSN